MKISFITDEVTQSFDEAVRFARQNGLAGLELRSVEDTAIDMLPAETLRTWRRRLDAEGLTVCGLAGSFYKCAPEPDAVEAELAKLERLCAAADILGCAFIRGFAFFAPEEGPLPAETLAPYFERPVRLLEQRGKTLLLEAGPPASTPRTMRRWPGLSKPSARPRVRAIFDPGQLPVRPLGRNALSGRLRGHPSLLCPCAHQGRGARCAGKLLRKGGHGAGGLSRSAAPPCGRTAMRAGCPWRPITVWIPT